jgi:acetolactate synthase I/III small subunit
MPETDTTIMELTVNNHSGVMSHITGLFARRAFNLEGILCGRIGDGEKSRIYLLVHRNDKVDQVMEQLRKLYDITEVRLRDDLDQSAFDRIDEALVKRGG